jgi:hypothetical protein
MYEAQNEKMPAAGLGIMTVIMKDTGPLPLLEHPRERASHLAGFLKGKMRL